MGRKHFREERIAFALRQAESGTSVPEVIQKLGFSEQTFYRWKKKCGGLRIDQAKRLKELEKETPRRRSRSRPARRMPGPEPATSGRDRPINPAPLRFLPSAAFLPAPTPGAPAVVAANARRHPLTLEQIAQPSPDVFAGQLSGRVDR